MKKIAVVTVARSDYGIYQPLLKALKKNSGVDLQLLVSGMHLSPEFGLTVKNIQEDGFSIKDSIEMLLSSDTPSGIAKSVGVGVLGFAQTFAHYQPDLLFILGDRFEMLAAATAALPFQIPIAHLHGGELTEGAFDDCIRHSLTKMSHLHFVSTDVYAKRVCQLGEETWRVHNVGAMSLDQIRSLEKLDKNQLASLYNSSVFEKDFLLATFHPVTLELEALETQVTEFLSALEAFKMPVVFTMANADPSGRYVNQKIQEFCLRNKQNLFVENFGMQNYFSVMSYAKAMVGNSSSGIVEAASFHLPVVNIGTRQDGRLRNKNVIDVGYSRDEIIKALKLSQTETFTSLCKAHVNLFGDAYACEKIMNVIEDLPVKARLLKKKFLDIPVVNF